MPTAHLEHIGKAHAAGADGDLDRVGWGRGQRGEVNDLDDLVPRADDVGERGLGDLIVNAEFIIVNAEFIIPYIIRHL